jgi:CubicO group peptidase (beta-lactamase class C family)
VHSTSIAIVALLGLPLIAGTIPVGKPEEVGLSSERLKRVGEAVQRHIDAGNVAGAVTLVARKGRIAHFRSARHDGPRVEEADAKDGLFRLASMSKPITGRRAHDARRRGQGPASTIQCRDFIPEFKGLDKVAVAKPGCTACQGRR